MATSNTSDSENDCSETKSKRNSETEEKEDDGGKMSSSKSKRGRGEEVEKCSPDIIKEESKKLKKMVFHWNWRDEYTILENLYEFAGKNGSYSKEFYNFVKKKLSVEVSNSQLSDKVYRLRKRFLKDKSKIEDGKLMKFSNDHNYEKLFELSSNIWGDQQISQSGQSGGCLNLNPNLQWNAEAVDGWYGKLLKRYFEKIKVDITCIPPNVLQDIRKDWEDMMTAETEYQLKNANLLAEISHIRCTQNI